MQVRAPGTNLAFINPSKTGRGGTPERKGRNKKHWAGRHNEKNKFFFLQHVDDEKGQRAHCSIRGGTKGTQGGWKRDLAGEPDSWVNRWWGRLGWGGTFEPGAGVEREGEKCFFLRRVSGG